MSASLLAQSIATTLAALVTTAPPPSDQAAANPPQLGWGDTYSVAGALAELPDVRGYLHVSTADLASFSTMFGIPRPAGSDDPQLSVWVDELAAGRHVPIAVPDVFNTPGVDTIAEWGDAIGWTGYVDAHSFVDLRAGGRAGERSITVLSGAFDGDAFGPAVTPIGGGLFTFGSGNDGEPDPTNTAFAADGSPLRMAAKDGRVAASYFTAPVTWWLAGPQPTVADDATVGAIAEALDDGAALSALIQRAPYIYDRYSPTPEFPATPADIALAMDRTIVSQEFSAVGIGWTATTTTIAYAFGDSAAAEIAAGELETLYTAGTTYAGVPVADGVELQNVVVSDRLVVLSVGEETPWEIWTLFYGRDTPFTFLPLGT